MHNDHPPPYTSLPSGNTSAAPQPAQNDAHLVPIPSNQGGANLSIGASGSAIGLAPTVPAPAPPAAQHPPPPVVSDAPLMIVALLPPAVAALLSTDLFRNASFVTAPDPSTLVRPSIPHTTYYVVTVGMAVGIIPDWDSVRALVHGVSGSFQVGLPSWEQAVLRYTEAFENDDLFLRIP
ncbi:hypothetical protein NLJ89_g10872 [Agrocybe chaxingu]|uniref:Uncharacterized protein n=1 Tax=Agrocybe chaxingu TaxID=84603 RepID=A0A9W8MPW3_9AGAR|nr:hypothetical protein NLJ89_g10872 [Agrocybe chaxingu]